MAGSLVPLSLAMGGGGGGEGGNRGGGVSIHCYCNCVGRSLHRNSKIIYGVIIRKSRIIMDWTVDVVVHRWRDLCTV